MTTLSNREVVTAFFSAYRDHQPEQMGRWLHPEVEFSDLAFEKLTGDNVGAMWHWFCVPFGKRDQPIKVPDFEITGESGDTVLVRYRVRYELDRGKHKVDYPIASTVTLRDGRIRRQEDRLAISKFRFAWMAAGFPNCLFAYTPQFDKKLRAKMSGGLAAFLGQQQLAQAAKPV